MRMGASQNRHRVDVERHPPPQLRLGGERGQDRFAHVRAMAAFQKDLRAIFAPEPGDGRRRRYISGWRTGFPVNFPGALRRDVNFL